jgi:hypothetical protein
MAVQNAVHQHPSVLQAQSLQVAFKQSVLIIMIEGKTFTERCFWFEQHFGKKKH